MKISKADEGRERHARPDESAAKKVACAETVRYMSPSKLKAREHKQQQDVPHVGRRTAACHLAFMSSLSDRRVTERPCASASTAQTRKIKTKNHSRRPSLACNQALSTNRALTFLPPPCATGDGRVTEMSAAAGG